MYRVFVCGDIHGAFNSFNKCLKNLSNTYAEENVCVLVCGDFGYWPRDVNIKTELIVPGNVFVYFCPGNHEDWEALHKLKLDANGMYEVTPNVWYCSFGSKLDIDGTIYMFLGGAESVDRFYRIPDVSWFKHEGITEEAMSELLAKDMDLVDVVISHTCPDCVRGDTIAVCDRIYPVFPNPDLGNSEKQLERFNEAYKPKHWYYGHFHTRNTIKKDNHQIFEALGDIYLPFHEWMMEHTDGRVEVQAID